jgi:predicted MFS family arabinose efflux permease
MTNTKVPFTSYQKFAIFILAITQFTVILDFMVMSPLGDMLMKSMDLKPSQFGLAVSAYALSAGVSGLLTAGFADRFDRKRLLVFFYSGFIAGTILCGLAHTYWLLMAARIITGLFGGVMGSISMAIITDLFDIHHRGRVMGFVQMGLGASQALGIPISLSIANRWGWQSPFLMVACLSAIIIVIVITRMAPVDEHLKLKQDKNPFLHLLHTLGKRNYRIGFLATALLSIGGFMMMPFSAAFAVNNLKIASGQLPELFMVSGVSALIIMPAVGKLSDKIDKFTLFTCACALVIGIVIFYTHLSVTPLWEVMICNIIMIMGVLGRMVPSSALMTAIPDAQDRGAFMSVSSSLQQIAGGIAAAFAGMIVVQKDKTSPLEHYTTLGYVMTGITLVSIMMVYRVSMLVKKKMHERSL